MQALGVFANLGSSQYATGWMEAVWLNPEPKQPRSTVHCDVCAIDWSTHVLPEVLHIHICNMCMELFEATDRPMYCIFIWGCVQKMPATLTAIGNRRFQQTLPTLPCHYRHVCVGSRRFQRCCALTGICMGLRNAITSIGAHAFATLKRSTPVTHPAFQSDHFVTASFLSFLSILSLFFSR